MAMEPFGALFSSRGFVARVLESTTQSFPLGFGAPGKFPCGIWGSGDGVEQRDPGTGWARSHPGWEEGQAPSELLQIHKTLPYSHGIMGISSWDSAGLRAAARGIEGFTPSSRDPNNSSFRWNFALSPTRVCFP